MNIFSSFKNKKSIILQLVAVLKEVKHLLALERENLPEVATKLYAKVEKYIIFNNYLDLVSESYNRVRKSANVLKYITLYNFYRVKENLKFKFRMSLINHI